MDPALAVLLGTAITGLASVIVAGIGAWVSVTKSEDRATIRHLRMKVTALGGDPDED